MAEGAQQEGCSAPNTATAAPLNTAAPSTWRWLAALGVHSELHATAQPRQQARHTGQVAGVVWCAATSSSAGPGWQGRMPAQQAARHPLMRAAIPSRGSSRRRRDVAVPLVGALHLGALLFTEIHLIQPLTTATTQCRRSRRQQERAALHNAVVMGMAGAPPLPLDVQQQFAAATASCARRHPLVKAMRVWRRVGAAQCAHQ